MVEAFTGLMRLIPILPHTQFHQQRHLSLRNATLLKGLSPDDITLEETLKLIVAKVAAVKVTKPAAKKRLRAKSNQRYNAS